MTVISCKNCGGLFTRTEASRMKAPTYPWPLTALGRRALAENEANGGDPRPCPTCGHRTLGTSSPSPSPR